MNIWTARSVHFTPFPHTSDADWERFIDALAEHYYDPTALVGRWGSPSVGARSGVALVSGLPWWMPSWWARRTVATIAATCGLGGDAEYHVERAVLPR